VELTKTHKSLGFCPGSVPHSDCKLGARKKLPWTKLTSQGAQSALEKIKVLEN